MALIKGWGFKPAFVLGIVLTAIFIAITELEERKYKNNPKTN